MALVYSFIFFIRIWGGFFFTHGQSADKFTPNHSILLSDPGNESQRSRGFKTPSENKIDQVVAEIMDERSRWQFQKVYQNRIPLNLQRPCVKKNHQNRSKIRMKKNETI